MSAKQEHARENTGPRGVTLTIDGAPVRAAAGENLLVVAQRNGIAIPALCYHPRISVTGGCRLCVVKRSDRPGMVPSCTLQASEGLSIVAFDEELLKLIP